MTSKPKAKILMSQKISGAYDDLNEHRSMRYNQRQRAAEGNGLNFRKFGLPVKIHGIRRYLMSVGHHVGAHGLCAVCAKEAQVCECKIEVRDNSGMIVNVMEV